MATKLGEDSRTLYEILGVPPSSDQETIRRAYIDLIKQVHPDLHPGREEEAKRLNSAYDVLSDPEQRRIYDEFLQGVPCPHCGTQLRTEAEAAAHFNYHFEEARGFGEGCAVCGRGPTGLFSFRANQGFLVSREVYGFYGRLCQSCAVGVFRVFQTRNLTRGWWGFISFFATLWYLLKNVASFHGHGTVPQPIPSEPDIEASLRGRPVFGHPSVWVALAVVIGLGWWAGSSAQSRSGGLEQPAPSLPTFAPPAPVEIPPLDPAVLCDPDVVAQAVLRGVRVHGRAIDIVNEYVDSGVWSTTPDATVERLKSAHKRLTSVVTGSRIQLLSPYGTRLVRAGQRMLNLDVRLVRAAAAQDVPEYNELVDRANSAAQEFRSVLRRDGEVC